MTGRRCASSARKGSNRADRPTGARNATADAETGRALDPAASDNAAWTTRLDPSVSLRFGIEETHVACFEPPNWQGKGALVTFIVPECETQFIVPGFGPIIARPLGSANVKRMTRSACDLVAETDALLIFAGDTAEQVETGTRRVTRRLPRWRRVALERMYEPQSRVRDRLL